jgi:hypothetical protein
MENFECSLSDFDGMNGELDLCFCDTVQGSLCSWCIDIVYAILIDSTDHEEGGCSPQLSYQATESDTIMGEDIFYEPDEMMDEDMVKEDMIKRSPHHDDLQPACRQNSHRHLAGSRKFILIAPKFSEDSQDDEPIHQGRLSTSSRSSSEDRPYECGFCDETFTENKNRHRHRMYNCSISKYTIQILCPICQADFTRPDALTKHLKDVHKRCSVCNESFSTASEVMEHKRNSHPKRKRSSESST